MGALEMQSVISGNEYVNLSRQQAIDCTSSASACCGGISQTVYDKNKKYAKEEDYPYLYSKWNVTGEDKCQVYNCSIEDKDTVVEIKGYDRVSCSSGDEMKKLLWKYGPVPASINVYEGFSYYTGGIFNASARSAGRITGHHAVVVIGYGPDYITIRNSWGPRWGEYGDCRVSSRTPRESGGIISTVERVCVVGVEYSESSSSSSSTASHSSSSSIIHHSSVISSASGSSDSSSKPLPVSGSSRTMPIISYVFVAILSLLQLW